MSRAPLHRSAIRTLVVDDEPIARRGIRHLLKERGDIDVIGECANGHEAVEAVRRDRPDLVFLDVQMPGLDGFGVVRTVGPQEMPCVVFVTAFDEYAIDAFAVAAVDYVVKPYSPERLFEATDRATRRIREQRVVAAHEQLLRALGDMPADGLPDLNSHVDDTCAARILVSVGSKSIVVPVEDVNLFEADGNYVRVRTASAHYTLRESLKELELRIDPRRFVRIHRSAIVRIAAVRSLDRADHERLVLVLEDGARLPVSRARRDAVVRTIGSIRG